MSTIFSYLSTAAAAACLFLGVWLFSLSRGNQKTQGDLQEIQQMVQSQQQVLQGQQRQLQTQQEQINAGTTISQQVGPALLRDMAVVSTKNEKMKELLARHGYSVEAKDNTATGGATSQP